MAPTLYIAPASPPVRAVLMFAKAIGLEINLKEVDFQNNEHRTPEYLKLNPQHTVPTLEDDGFSIWDSHAIIPYLYTVYGKDDALYPKEPKARALIDQRLHFNSGVAFSALKNTLVPIYQRKKSKVSDEDRESIAEVYDLMEIFLEGRQWVAGDSISIADYALIATITSLDLLHKIDPAKYQKISTWLERAKELPEYELNTKGLDIYRQYLEKFC